MLITFSNLLSYPRSHITKAASPLLPSFTWSKGREVRFTLPGATTAQHESVILALLELDPRATIRTSRARYAGLGDYVRQNASKLAFHHIDGDPRNNATENLRVVQVRAGT